jgi:hypothetical protein
MRDSIVVAAAGRNGCCCWWRLCRGGGCREVGFRDGEDAGQNGTEGEGRHAEDAGADARWARER